MYYKLLLELKTISLFILIKRMVGKWEAEDPLRRVKKKTTVTAPKAQAKHVLWTQ